MDLKRINAALDDLRSMNMTQTAMLQDRVDAMGVNCTRFSLKDWQSGISQSTTFTAGGGSIVDVVTPADEVVNNSIVQGLQMTTDPSLIIGTVTVTHKHEPRFVPTRAKYDTVSEVNFIEGVFA